MWDDFAGHVLYIANVIIKDIFSTIMYGLGQLLDKCSKL